MRPHVVVISKLHLVRRQLSESLTPLGYTVYDFSDIMEPLRVLDTLEPKAIIIDGDGLEDRWKILFRALRTAGVNLAMVLLKSIISVPDAKEAVQLGAATVIVKPFTPADHVPRITTIIDRSLNIQEKRKARRFYPDSSTVAEVRYYYGEQKRLRILSVENVSEHGATLLVRSPHDEPELQAGAHIASATLRLQDRDIPITFRVVFRDLNKVGILFEPSPKGRSQLNRVLQGFVDRVFSA